MGRLERLRKKRHKKHGKDQSYRPKAVGSDPEPCATPRLGVEQHCGSYTNSCDEEMCNSQTSTCTPGPSNCGQEHSPADEMEVTRKLSCLNFSVLPCGTLEMEPLSTAMDSSLGRNIEILSDVDLCSELASATQLDILPTLSDRDGEEMDGLDACYRYARKRPSRRKTNRRAKKFRYINARDSSASKQQTHSVPLTPLPLGITRTSSRESPGSHGVRGQGSPRLLRTRSLRWLRRKRKANQEDDPLLCFYSDTSVVSDIDTPNTSITIARGNQEMEGMECALPPPMEAQWMCDDSLPIESELSESSSDSGCEGDDEESSVEGPATAATPLLSKTAALFPRPPGPLLDWWVEQRGDLLSPGKEKFQQILKLAAEGRGQECGPLSAEFKHPGHLGVCGHSGRKKRCKPRELTTPLTLKDINHKIVMFVQDTSLDSTELKFQLVSRALCKTISALACVYQLECLVQQKRRLPVASPVLRKTCFTRLATNEEVEPILSRHGVSTKLLASREGFHSRSNIYGFHSKSGGYQGLDRSNVGNQMLQGMGWVPGTGLGPECDGIQSPVKAYPRHRRTGLGFS